MTRQSLIETGEEVEARDPGVGRVWAQWLRGEQQRRWGTHD
ncbi:MAG TPA: hypothetical protein PKE45_01135 [Caldilineaceae bacterium]|nr:hypothetical protein [Caldilineaceae bacterium]